MIRSRHGKHASMTPAQAKGAGRAKHMRHIGIVRLAARSSYELILFNGVISLSIAALLSVMGRLARWLLAVKGTALTTANLATVLLSWQGILLIAVSLILSASYIALDLFAHIYFCQQLLEGDDRAFRKRAFEAIKDAFVALRRFASIDGLPTILFILIITPLVGVGFSIGLTRSLYAPSFIMDVVNKTPLYAVAYFSVLIIAVVVGILHIFTIHGVLIDGLKPSEARRRSRRMVCTHPLRIVKGFIKIPLATFALSVVLVSIYMFAHFALTEIGEGFPEGFHEGAAAMVMHDQEPTELSLAISLYRSACFFACILSYTLSGVITLFSGSYMLLYSTHFYRWLSTDAAVAPTYPSNWTKRRFWLIILYALTNLLGMALISLVAGITYDVYLEGVTPTNVVVHRMGGNAAPENSLQGLEFAITEGCYGAETDIQRTKDGHYVINHDSTFARLTGNTAAPQDLTLEEVKQLRIHDPLHPDEEVEVPTLEEALAVAKGHIKLFIELKGNTADRQMVDDTVRIVREMGATDDVVLISLNYDCISYAKKTYPEFTCGLLFFAEYGDMSLIDCDILLAEEETATTSFVDMAHASDKEVGVWTANTREVLRKIMDGDADYVITDEAVLAKEVQRQLDSRTDLEAISDMILGSR